MTFVEALDGMAIGFGGDACILGLASFVFTSRYVRLWCRYACASFGVLSLVVFVLALFVGAWERTQ